MRAPLLRAPAVATLLLLPPAAAAQRPADPARPTSPARAVSPLGVINPEWIAAHVRFLSDALLEGRETGTRGAELAARYVGAQLEQLGLAPLGRDSGFVLPVPMRLSTVRAEGASLTLATAAGARALAYGEDWVLHADKVRDRVELRGPVTFVGWGVSCREAGYDDYRGVDVRGRFAAMVMGAPPSLPPDERGHCSTLALKERAALDHGAIGVITLLPGATPEALYKVNQLEGYAWVDPRGAPHSPYFETGAAVRLTDAGTAALLAAAGRRADEVLAALARGPLSFPIDATVTLRAAFEQRPVTAYNAGAVLRGADPALAGEYVVYSAHLDHVGVGRAVDGDSVYHGALDNAGGTAAVMAVARAFAALPRPRRSVIFLAVTGEEKGILGSDYFARHPPVPREALVADVNLDNFLMFGPIRDLAAYGARYSTLDRTVASALRRLGIQPSADPLPAMTVFTRSDHYAFMRQGVPGVMLFPGPRSGTPGVQQRWFDRVHHTPRDRVDQGIDWAAGVRFAEANLLIGWEVANARERPAWRGRYFFHEGAVQ